MHLAVAAHFRELSAKLIVNPLGTVPDHGEAAAALWPFRAERRHNDVPTRLQGVPNCGHVPLSEDTVGEEVKDCAIMPEVVLVLREPGVGDVPDKPAHRRSLRPKPRLGLNDRTLRQVDDGDVPVAAGEQVVHQC